MVHKNIAENSKKVWKCTKKNEDQDPQIVLPFSVAVNQTSRHLSAAHHQFQRLIQKYSHGIENGRRCQNEK